jgi:hypothetical protein
LVLLEINLKLTAEGVLAGVEDGVYGYDPAQDVAIVSMDNGEAVAIVNTSLGAAGATNSPQLMLVYVCRWRRYFCGKNLDGRGRPDV